ncbi:MAG: substrate-binding domain-containing protein [Spirochaetales bacterium]|jgi:D-xylose transport system substrate-binding protein|nr:substrate-binding domain-containing protein [Spirochaetales bacterium]
MKKIVSFSIAAAALAALALTSCAPQAPAGPKKLVIGASLPTQREAVWVKGRQAMEKAAEAAGVILKVQSADADAAQQATQVDSLLSQGIQALILAPADATTAAAMANKAAAQKVPVISYDRLILDTPNIALYVSFDNVKVGEMQGEWLTKAVPKGNYLIMSGDPGDNNAKLFKQGAMNVIEPLVKKGDIKIVGDQAVANWLPSNALTIVEQALTANKNKINAILAPNDGTAGGAIQALNAQKLAGKVAVTGQDAEVAGLQRILDGTQGMTVFKDNRKEAEASVAAAVALAQGQPVSAITFDGVSANQTVNNGNIDVPALLLNPEVITKANVMDVVNSGYVKASDLKMTK